MTPCKYCWSVEESTKDMNDKCGESESERGASVLEPLNTLLVSCQVSFAERNVVKVKLKGGTDALNPLKVLLVTCQESFVDPT